MTEKVEIRIAGLGGQGVVLAGVLLGTAAAVYDNKHVVQTQSYGAEARGGAARSEVIISASPIIYPKVLQPDLFVAMSQTALDKYISDLKNNGTLFIDEELVTTLPHNNFNLYKARFSEAATEKLGRSLFANIIMLGFLTSLTEITSAEAITEAIRTGVPKGTEELNLKALDLGREMADNLPSLQ
jgi:2-oxoglutarate ferredoxin oxidoreductase subunit gamma